MSKKLNSAQRNYSVTERECLAVVEAIRKFRCYVELQEFEVITDHSSLLWLMKQQDLTGRLARWVFKLQGYKFTFSHRKGRDHIVPDALSRIYCDDISAITFSEPEVDLSSPHFFDQDYNDLKEKIVANESKYPDLKIIGTYVYIRTDHYHGDEEQEERAWKLWIPANLRQDIISRFHNSPVACHGGIQKTLELIRRNFFWPGMIRDVKEFIRSCETCKTTKSPNQILKPEMGKPAFSVRPFQRLYIDLLGPYPRSRSGNIGILIILDHMSKFHWLHPLKKFTSSRIQDFLQQHIFHVYGVPEVIISDNGSQFKSNEFNAFLTSFGINHTYTALYSPQSNASERVNRSILAGIRSFLKSDHRLWDENLSSISCALRNSVHQSTKISPYHAIFGFDMITHATSYQLLRDLKMLDEPSNILSRDDNLKLIRSNIRKHIAEAYSRNQHQYNLRTRPINFEVGQEVFRRNFAQSNAEKNFNAKLSPIFLKAKIKEKVGQHYYILEDMTGKIIGTFHAKDIRP